jgi:hypothetical protein
LSHCWTFNGSIELLSSSLESFESFWPLSFSGSFESSFVSRNRVLVVNKILSKFSMVHDVVGLSSGPFIDNFISVGNSDVKSSVSFGDLEVFHLVLESFSVLLVDDLLLLNVCLNILFPFFSLVNSVVVVGNEIVSDGFV